MSDWMRTHSGGRFYVSDVTRTKIKLEDISHGLSHICRFGGHTKFFYSVAQHSLMVADIVKALGGTVEQEMWALMHDSTEAYMGDIPTPLKHTLTNFGAREEVLMGHIDNQLSLPDHGGWEYIPSIVKQADKIALVTEARQLCSGVRGWGVEYKGIKSFGKPILERSPNFIKKRFEARYKKLRKELDSHSQVV